MTPALRFLQGRGCAFTKLQFGLGARHFGACLRKQPPPALPPEDGRLVMAKFSRGCAPDRPGAPLAPRDLMDC
jgi:hypothetical protein